MKKIISIITVTVVMLSALCSNVSAYDYEVTEETKCQYLSWAKDDLYNLGDGNPYYFIAEDYRALDDSIFTVFNDPNSAEADYKTVSADIIDFAFERQYISENYAEKTYQNALLETNSDGWYTDAEWSDFQSKLADLKTALDSFVSRGQDLADDKVLTDAFHALLKAYNTMTNRDALAGDVNGDGCVNIRDVTMVQSYLAEFEPLNGAQKMRAALSGLRECNDISIDDVIQLQRYLADFIKTPANTNRDRFVFVDEVDITWFMPLVSEDLLTERMLNFAICPSTIDESECGHIGSGFYSPRNFIQSLAQRCFIKDVFD